MPASPRHIDWDRIEGFIGFGNPTAPYVFLGMEEGLLSEDNLDADLAARSKYDSYMDLFDAQARLTNTAKYFGERPKNQPTWRPICDLMLRLTTGIKEPTRNQRLRYMADLLGRRRGETLLAELMPYPRRRVSKASWPYKKYGRFDDYKSYRESILPMRLALLRSVLEMPCDRKLVVAYGKSDWPDFKRLFDTEWTTATPYEWARTSKVTVVLTPQLATRDFNSQQDLNRFANVAFEALGTST